MKKNLILIAMLCCAFMWSSCDPKDQSSPTPTPEPLTNVYVAGYAFNSSGIARALYWKNGVPEYLSDGTQSEYALAIAVSGNDVYVAGVSTNAQNNRQAKYWKNGVAVLLSDGTVNAWTSSITVVGNDVYVAGYENVAPGTSLRVAKYWKNGVSIALSDGANVPDVTTILVSDNDVYVAGTESVGASLNLFYWKNAVQVPVNSNVSTSQIVDTRALSLAIRGDDVYMAGSDKGGNGIYLAKYWKNGVATTVSDGVKNAFPTGIAFMGQDVYLCGRYDYAPGVNPGKAACWKNGTMTLLPGGGEGSGAVSIAVMDSDVYTAGYDSNGRACYWKNGELVFTAAENTAAFDMKVVKQ
ncbi:MAG: hypothetical protein EOP49_41005 [Sphingobacteriales bacterium]|nr:MAG: hypothetical protein EOP49_41005 [Sphingobacteriales bacterium]